MRRVLFIGFYTLILLVVTSTVRASSILPSLLSSDQYYTLFPNQLPLSEQLSTVVNLPANPIQTVQKKPIKIVFMLSDNLDELTIQAVLTSFKRRLGELGIVSEIWVYKTLKRAHLEEIYTHIQQHKPDYLIATGLGMVQSRIVSKVLQRGNEKVIFLNFANPLSSWKYHPPFMYAGFDQTKIVKILASYLDRQLPKKTYIAALVLPSGFLNDLRCNGFLDSMSILGRDIDTVQTVPNDAFASEKAATTILKSHPHAFIFSCTQPISDGVVTAIKRFDRTAIAGDTLPQTNSWGTAVNEVSDLIHRYVLVSTLFMWDNLAIAVAEGIKGDLEGVAVPALYIGKTSVMSSDQGAMSLHLILQQAYRYSAVLQ